MKKLLNCRLLLVFVTLTHVYPRDPTQISLLVFVFFWWLQGGRGKGEGGHGGGTSAASRVALDVDAPLHLDEDVEDLPLLGKGEGLSCGLQNTRRRSRQIVEFVWKSNKSGKVRTSVNYR
jgi:hypothetical protein